MRANIYLRSIGIAFVLSVCLALPATGFAQQTAKQSKSDPPPKVRFRPPTKAAPPVRVTGGSRGGLGEAVRLDVLAPDAVGLTTQLQPSLFWYQSKPADANFELTLLQDNRIKPLVQIKIDRAVKAGIQRLKLADHDVELAPNVEYQWVVALIVDPDSRSSDMISSGVIKCVECPEDLKRTVAQASPESLPSVYAEAGIWYDALSALSDQIDANPDDQGLHAVRADLLRQVGLAEAADSL